jgi:hypothetical protein
MQWSPIKHTKSLPVETDPYFHWRLGAGATRCDPNSWTSSQSTGPLRPVVIHLKERETASNLESWAGTALSIPSFYTDPTQKLKKARWCTGRAEPKFFELLKTEGARQRISRVAVLSEIGPSDECASQSTDEWSGESEHPTQWSKDSVVIGIIDFGFAFAHERFRLTPAETRIEYLWVQDAPETASSELPYGHEITAGTINRWLEERGGCMDEDALYRRAADLLGRRWQRSVSRRMAHGTHMLDLASGYRLDEPLDKNARGQRPIVCVQLPEATVADTSGASLDSYVLDGIRYILQRADEIAKRGGVASLPVVINFSSGEVAGPHDGTSDLEQAIDELIELRSEIAPLEVVVSAGNSHLGRLHAQVKFENLGKTVDLPWRVLPDDSSPSFLEVWLPTSPSAPPEGESRIGLQVTTPGGLSSDWLEESPGARTQLLSDSGEVLCEARYCYIDQLTKRGMFLVALQPTLRIDPTYPRAAVKAVAPSGRWNVSLANRRLGKDQSVEAWIQWDDAPLGFPRRGRQSHFDEKRYKRFDAQGREIEEDTRLEQLASPCHVKRAGSMNAIATGGKTIVVGGSMGDQVRPPAKYSAGGPGQSLWPRPGPDVTAVSDDSIVHLGVLAAGTRSGSVVAMNGTSVAAPQVTRLIARDLAARLGPSAASTLQPWRGGRLEILEHILEHVPPSQVRSAASGAGQAGNERTGAGCVGTERPPGVSTRGGVRRFEEH